MLDLIRQAAMVAFFVYAIHCGVNLFFTFYDYSQRTRKNMRMRAKRGKKRIIQ